MAKKLFPLRIGQWNVEKAHPVNQTVSRILHIFDREHIEVFVLLECMEYAHALARAASDRGDKLIWFNDQPWQNQNVILVRKGTSTKNARILQATKTRWASRRGHLLPLMWAPSVLIDGWLWIVGVHTPPSVKWPTRIPIGPVRRVAAFAQYVRRLKQFARWHRGTSSLFIGDWNCASQWDGLYTPRWLARQIGGRIWASGRSTYHIKRDIDYAVGRDVWVTDIEVLDENVSDHRCVVYNAQPARGR